MQISLVVHIDIPDEASVDLLGTTLGITPNLTVAIAEQVLADKFSEIFEVSKDDVTVTVEPVEDADEDEDEDTDLEPK